MADRAAVHAGPETVRPLRRAASGPDSPAGCRGGSQSPRQRGTMSEFPCRELEALAVRCANEGRFSDAALVTDAINRHEELSLRCCEDNTKHSLTIAGLRQR